MSPHLADLVILLMNFISASTYLATRNAVEAGPAAVPALTFVALRFFVAAAALAVFFRGRIFRLRRESWFYGSIIGVICSVALVLMTEGLRDLQSGSAAFLVNICSALIPFVDRLLYKEPLQPAAVLGIGIALCGVHILSGGAAGEFGPAAWMLIGSAVLFAFHAVLNARFSRYAPPLELGIVQVLSCGAAAAAAACLAETPQLPSSSSVWMALLYLGVVATAVRFLIQVYAQAFTTPTRAGVMFVMEPVIAAAYGWILADERLSPAQIFGCGLILAGAVIAQSGAWYRGRRLRQETVS